jgi:hypothetical protein
MITLGEFTFKTKKELRETINKIKDEYLQNNNGIIPKDSDLHKMLHELLRRNKTSKWLYRKFDSFLVKYNHDCYNVLAIHAKQFDSSVKMIGLTRLITNIDHDFVDIEAQIRKNLKTAMRQCIQPQVNFFKSLHDDVPLICENCDSTKKLQVDHILPFSLIRRKFIESVGSENLPDEFDWEDCLPSFKKRDAEFSTGWCNFHKKFATYQILCKPCNLAKSDTVKSGDIPIELCEIENLEKINSARLKRKLAIEKRKLATATRKLEREKRLLEEEIALEKANNIKYEKQRLSKTLLNIRTIKLASGKPIIEQMIYPEGNTSYDLTKLITSRNKTIFSNYSSVKSSKHILVGEYVSELCEFNEKLVWSEYGSNVYSTLKRAYNTIFVLCDKSNDFVKFMRALSDEFDVANTKRKVIEFMPGIGTNVVTLPFSRVMDNSKARTVKLFESIPNSLLDRGSFDFYKTIISLIVEKPHLFGLCVNHVDYVYNKYVIIDYDLFDYFY